MNQSETTEATAQANGGTTDERSQTAKIGIDNSQLDYATTLKTCEQNSEILVAFRVLYIVGGLIWLIVVSIIKGPMGLLAWPVWTPFLVFMVMVLSLDIWFSRTVNRKKQAASLALYRQRRAAEEIRRRQEAQRKAEQWEQWAQEAERKAREEENAKQKAEQAKQQALEARRNEAQAWVKQCSEAGGLVTIPSNFPCKRGEGVLFEECDIKLMETRKFREKNGKSVDQWTTIDTGKVVVTNTRLVFIGDKGNRTVLVHDIVNMTAYADALDISSIKREKPMSFLWRNPSLLSTIIKVIQKYPDLKIVPSANTPINHGDGKEKQIDPPPARQSMSDEDEKSTSLSHPIPSGYLEMVKDAADSIGAFVSELSSDENVNNVMNQITGIDIDKTKEIFSTDNPKLGLFVTEDIMKCIVGLGYQLDSLGEAEAVGLWYALSQVMRLPEIENGAWNQKTVRERLIPGMIKTVQSLQRAVSISYQSHYHPIGKPQACV